MLPETSRPGLTAGDKGEVDDALQVGQHILRLDRQHHLPHGIQPLRVSAGIGVDSGGEGLEAGAHEGSLGPVPGAGALRDPHGPHVLVAPEIAGSPVLGRPAPGLAVQLQQQVAVAGRLRPAEGVEQLLGAGGEDVRHTPGVPQDLCRSGRLLRREILAAGGCPRGQGGYQENHRL